MTRLEELNAKIEAYTDENYLETHDAAEIGIHSNAFTMTEDEAIVIPGRDPVIYAGHPGLDTVTLITDGLNNATVEHSGCRVVISRGTDNEVDDLDDCVVVTLYDADGKFVGRIVTQHAGRG